MVTYRIPPPAHAAQPAAAPSVNRWALGLAASRYQWPDYAYRFRLPAVALPLYNGHEERQFTPSGFIDGAAGHARYFADVRDVGLVCLIEVSAEHPSLVWDWAEGRQAGLSVLAEWRPNAPGEDGLIEVQVREVSFTSDPRDPRARIVSLGQMALDDWQTLTGEEVTV